jgi:hypothetical protein
MARVSVNEVMGEGVGGSADYIHMCRDEICTPHDASHSDTDTTKPKRLQMLVQFGLRDSIPEVQMTSFRK